MAKRKRSKRTNPPTARYLGYALAGLGAYLLFKKWKGMGATTDPAKSAIEKTVGPMVEPTPSVPGSPTNVRGWWRNYVPARPMTPADMRAVYMPGPRPSEPVYMSTQLPAPGQFSPDGMLVDQPVLYKTLTRADAGRGASPLTPANVSRVTMESKEPDPAQASPGSESQMLAQKTEQDFKRSLGVSFNMSLNAKRISPDFLLAYQEKKLASLPKNQQDAARKSENLTFLPVVMRDGAVADASPEAIAAEFYSKKDLSSADPALVKQMNDTANKIDFAKRTKNSALASSLEREMDSIKGRLSSQSGNELKKYQDAYVEQVKLQKQLDQRPSDQGLQRKFASVSDKLARMDAQAQTGYKQAVEIKQLDAAQDNEKRQFVEIAKGLGYKNIATGKDARGNIVEVLDWRDPVLNAAAADMRNNQAVERQRLKEKQMGMEEGRGRDNKSVPAASARAEAGQAASQIRAAAEISSRRDEAAELVKVAVEKRKYNPLPGESFEDSVKKEMKTGGLSKDTEIRAAADLRLQKMRSSALAQQQTAKAEQDNLARIKALKAAAETPEAAKESPQALYDKQWAAHRKALAAKPSFVTITGPKSGGSGPPPEATQQVDSGYATAAAATRSAGQSRSASTSSLSIPATPSRSTESGGESVSRVLSTQMPSEAKPKGQGSSKPVRPEMEVE